MLPPPSPICGACRAFARASATAALTLAAALSSAAPLGADLEGLLEAARSRNPELAALQGETDAARQRLGPSGALPDPVLRVELENLNNSEARRDTRYTLMQSLPAWDKRELRQGVAEAELAQAQARSAATWSELALRIKSAYAQYYGTVAGERLVREQLDLADRLEKVSQSRYAAGLVPQQDVIRAQLERTALQAELIALDNDKRQLRARLNTLLARDPDEPLADPQALRPLPAEPALAASRLRDRARAHNPSLQLEAARVQGAQRNRELTERNRTPDVTLGVVPTQMGSRIASWGVMVEVNIPLQQSTRRAQEGEAAAMVSAARAREEAASRQVAGELGEQAAAYEAARRNEALVRMQLLPQSELSLQSALSAYENGKVDFATLLEAQRQIRKARSDLLKAEVDARVRLAEIERTVGEAL